MANRSRKYTPPEKNILRELFPITSFVGAFVGIVVWVYSTFATQAQLRENVDQLKQAIKTSHDSTIEHSDLNRDRMLTAIEGIKDALKVVDQRMRDKDLRKHD